MDNLKKCECKIENKGSKVLDKIKEIQSNKVTLDKREQKHNYIHSLRSKNVPVKFEVRMKEDFKQTFGPNVKLQNGKKYDFEVVKYDYYGDGKLAVSCFVGGTDDQFKIFTDRFDILADQKVICNTGIIDGAMVTIKKADPEIDGIAGSLHAPGEGKGVVSIKSLRGQHFYLAAGDQIEFFNTDEILVLGQKYDNRKEINKVIVSVKQGDQIKEEKFNEIYKIFTRGKYAEISEDEYYEGPGYKLVFDSRDKEWVLENQIEILIKYENYSRNYYIDYIY